MLINNSTNYLETTAPYAEKQQYYVLRNNSTNY